MTKLSTDRNELLIQGYKNKESIKQLALKYDIGLTYVRTLLRNAGLIEKKPRINATDRNKLLIQGYKNKESIEQLAKKYNIGFAYVRTLLQNSGLIEKKSHLKPTTK